MAKGETVDERVEQMALYADIHWGRPRLWRLRMMLATLLMWLAAFCEREALRRWVLGVGGIEVTDRGTD